MTRSASEPTAIRPLRGYRLSSLAALVLVTATNMFSSILPVDCETPHTYTHKHKHAYTGKQSQRYRHVLSVAAVSFDPLLPLFYRYRGRGRGSDTHHSLVPDEGHPLFHTVNTLWNLGEVILSNGLLGNTKGAVSAASHTEVSASWLETRKQNSIRHKTTAAASAGLADRLHCDTYLASSVFR